MKAAIAIGGMCILGVLGLFSLANMVGLAEVYPALDRVQSWIVAGLFAAGVAGGYLFLRWPGRGK